MQKQKQTQNAEVHAADILWKRNYKNKEGNKDEIRNYWKVWNYHKKMHPTSKIPFSSTVISNKMHTTLLTMLIIRIN